MLQNLNRMESHVKDQVHLEFRSNYLVNIIENDLDYIKIIFLYFSFKKLLDTI
jgi:hypothetical protein